ncbi:MAG TPA: hypothetical protein VMZ91_10640 [Candidatus Paceibacterota bacterium]|nr:hypothetical protein [Candidatus Paceibacterota bacterium]
MTDIWLKAIKFKESNNVAKGEGYFDLPTFKDDTQFISCWNVPFWKRIKFLFSGKVYVSLEHKNQTEELKNIFGGKNYHQPISVTIEKPFN